MKRVGLIVNPIAGMGGRVGLKGTDGPAALEQARALGAKPLSAERAAQALTILQERLGADLIVVTPPGPMGGDIAQSLGIQAIEHPSPAVGRGAGGEGARSVGRGAGGEGARSVGRGAGGEVPLTLLANVIPSRVEGSLVGDHQAPPGVVIPSRAEGSLVERQNASSSDARPHRPGDLAPQGNVIPSEVEGSLVERQNASPTDARQNRTRDSSTPVGMTGEGVGMTGEGVGRRVQNVGATTSADTRAAATAILSAGVDLLLFAGGDGTARDLFEAAGNGPPVLGIPTGVKMHSAVYATTPRAAGEASVNFLTAAKPKLRESEVMDIDEDAFRAGRLSARLYGYLQVPAERALVQSLKSGSTSGEGDLAGIAADIAERMQDGALWIMAPGTTTRSIAERLGVTKTLLGVDLVSRGELVESDVTEATILRHLDGVPARILVTPIGGQGYLFGRGNQQISPAVIRRVGRENIVVVATSTKLTGLRGGPLLVDTGDPALDAELAGYIRVVTGYRQESVQRVA